MAEHRDNVEVVYAGEHLEMVRSGKWEYVRRMRSVTAVGIIAVTDHGEMVLVEQLRVPVGTNVIEIPAGLVGDEQQFQGEKLETAAQRELLEETGFEARQWEYVCGGPSSAGMSDEQVHLFLATRLKKVGDGGGDASEDIAVHLVRLTEVEAFLQHQIVAGKQVDLKVWMGAWLAQKRGLAR